MKKRFLICAIESNSLMLEGDYGSDYKPFSETKSVLREFSTYDTEEEAVEHLPEFFDFSATLTILPIYEQK